MRSTSWPAKAILVADGCSWALAAREKQEKERKIASSGMGDFIFWGSKIKFAGVVILDAWQ
jgi:hypothetical protein